ncbi:MAG: hypothetical protein IPH98_19725 [Saprospiraceae bacterium]|nr:hypothetical protein [Candidatus Defluviibacterium haderslevense]
MLSQPLVAPFTIFNVPVVCPLKKAHTNPGRMSVSPSQTYQRDTVLSHTGIKLSVTLIMLSHPKTEAQASPLWHTKSDHWAFSRKIFFDNVLSLLQMVALNVPLVFGYFKSTCVILS